MPSVISEPSIIITTPARFWSCTARDAPLRQRLLVPGVEGRARPDEDVAEHGLDQPHEHDVAELPAGAEPGRLRQRLDDRRPHQRAAGEEEDVLQRVHRRVVQRRLVEERDVPDVEVDRPDRQRDVRVARGCAACRTAGSRAPAAAPARSGPTTKHSGARSPSRMCCDHVDEEEVRLAELVDRRVDRQHEQEDPEPEEELPPAGNGLAAPLQRPRAAEVERTTAAPSAGAGAARGSSSSGRRRRARRAVSRRARSRRRDNARRCTSSTTTS